MGKSLQCSGSRIDTLANHVYRLESKPLGSPSHHPSVGREGGFALIEEGPVAPQSGLEAREKPYLSQTVSGAEPQV